MGRLYVARLDNQLSPKHTKESHKVTTLAIRDQSPNAESPYYAQLHGGYDSSHYEVSEIECDVCHLYEREGGRVLYSDNTAVQRWATVCTPCYKVLANMRKLIERNS